MARARLRSRRQVLEQANQLAAGLRAGLAHLPAGDSDPDVIDAVWQGEGLGSLLWALELVELPPFDRPFDSEWLAGVQIEPGVLRPEPEIEHARETARLWHWRARTARLLEDDPAFELPAQWQSFDQLVAATAMRGHEGGYLPLPLRGDFPAFGTGYRELLPDQRAETLAIAYERHRALNWLCGLGTSWVETPTDT